VTRTNFFRTLTVAAALAASLLALAGAVTGLVEAQEVPPEAEVSATGMLTEAPPTAPPGTYFIIDGTGTPYELRSEVVNLGTYTGQLVTVFGTPAPVQEEPGGPVLLNVTRVEPIEGTGPFSVTFELAVQGTPPANATFFGLFGYEGGVPVRLTDPDGDGVYTGSTPPGLIPDVTVQPALIVQGTGTRESINLGTYPGDPIRVIKDFGPVTINQNTTLSTSVSFADGPGNLPDTGGPLPVLAIAALLLLSSSLFGLGILGRFS
jgi:hypothetical protein